VPARAARAPTLWNHPAPVTSPATQVAAVPAVTTPVPSPGGLSRSGVGFALAAYLAWGVAPIYWKQLVAVDSLDVIAHRSLWSALLAAGLVVATGRLRELRDVFRGRTPLALVASASMLLVNWWIFVWAVQNGRILDTSLGYYLNPLLNVAFGMLFFRERLTRAQWFAVGLASLAVAWLAWDLGSLPWISLALGGSFAIYGVLRKWAPVSSITGFGFETGLLVLPCLAWLAVASGQGRDPWQQPELFTPAVLALLAGGGVVTAFPLLCFASAARRLPLSVVGLFQYIAPSLALLTAVSLYDEPFTRAHGVAFALIWSGLAIFSWDGFLRAPRLRLRPPHGPGPRSPRMPRSRPRRGPGSPG